MRGSEGRCLCGTVRFEVVPPTLFCVHCHCRYCRSAHGAAFVTYFGVRDQQFKIVAGESSLSWYASSKQSQRAFCRLCGTRMFYVSTVCPGEIHVARALVDGAIDREPGAHVFFDQKVAWLRIDDTLPRFDSDSDALWKFRKIEAQDPVGT